MAYRPTGRAPGRPRGPVTPAGRVDDARKILPHVRAYPRMRQAVDRALMYPAEVINRYPTADSREVRLTYRYTPAERGQALTFVWWVYRHRDTWGRAKRKAAVTAVSPLMLFSSTLLTEMSGLPRTTTQKCMTRAAEIPAARVTGACDMSVVHQLLLSAAQGMDEYRETVRELSLAGGVPSALLSRISGVPPEILRRPERGVQFFPRDADRVAGCVCSPEQYDLYEKYGRTEKRKCDPHVGDQRAVREALAGTPLDLLWATSAPVPGEGQAPYHLAIPGLPRLRDAPTLGPAYYERIREWVRRYQLPAGGLTC